MKFPIKIHSRQSQVLWQKGIRKIDITLKIQINKQCSKRLPSLQLKHLLNSMPIQEQKTKKSLFFLENQICNA